MTKNTVAIEKSNKSDETTNSEERPITLILFSSNRNLTRTELNKTFAVKEGKLFQARKKHPIVADLFNNLFVKIIGTYPARFESRSHKPICTYP